MRKSTSVIFLAVFISQSASQLLTFKDGKIGVNFGGYHAGVGFGGLLGGNAGGGLYAEAGTPHGQSAVAGLGGTVGENGGPAGGLFAGATAGNGIKASAGLAGEVNSENSAAGTGFASAQAGNNYAATGMGGAASLEGSAGYTFSSKTNVVPVETVERVETVEVRPIHNKVHTEIDIDATNEVQPLPIAPEAHRETHTEVEKTVVHENVQPVLVKEVYVSQTPRIIEKEIIHTRYRPHRRHHYHRTAFVGGYIGGGGGSTGGIVETPVVSQSVVPPQIQRRVDVGAESSAVAGAAAEANANGGVGSRRSYTKEVSVQTNPTFFSDIFDIPISTLRAVGNFLGNTAANTHVSVQKSAEVQAHESESISSKHEPSSSPSSSSSSAQILVETPSASKIIDGILAIPINTLTAVNKFLENNVQRRKTLQVADDGTVEHSVRLGPAKRRANKRVVVIEEERPVESEKEQ